MYAIIEIVFEKSIATSGHYSLVHQSHIERAPCSKATGCVSKLHNTVCKTMQMLQRHTVLAYTIEASIATFINAQKQQLTHQDVHEGDDSHPTSCAQTQLKF